MKKSQYKLDLIDKTFGKWKVIERDNTDSRKWMCLCECGKIMSVFSYNLQQGKSKSCRYCKYNMLKKETLMFLSLKKNYTLFWKNKTLNAL